MTGICPAGMVYYLNMEWAGSALPLTAAAVQEEMASGLPDLTVTSELTADKI